MIATPCYGGMVFEPHFVSCLQAREYLWANGVEHTWLTTRNESLITRGRNTSAVRFLQSGFDRLLFIDADMDYEPEDIGKLWAMDADIAVGIYRMKKEGSSFAAWVNGELIKDLPDEPLSVDYAGTGFMMIKRGVFAKLMEAHPDWKYEESIGECWAFFQDPVEDGIHLSEDYFFCKRAREAGFEVMMDPSVKLGHWGLKRYA